MRDGFFFIFRGHVAGAHGPPGEVGFPAIPRAIAQFGGSENAIVIIKVVGGIELWCFLPGLESQRGIHGWRIHNLAGIEYIVRIPDVFYLLE